MKNLSASVGFLALVAAVGCSSTSANPTPDASDTSTLPCRLGESSDLPALSIHILRDDCTFTLAEARAGISIPYEVTVANDVDQVVVKPAPGTYCYQPGPSGLMVFERLSGSGQDYCLCDRGLPNPGYCGQSTTLHAGVYSAAFTWDGRNWTGPSDTNNPKGDHFPAGSYRLDIIAQGSQGAIDAGATAFSVNAAFGINLIK
jgi:hypothetical protein